MPAPVIAMIGPFGPPQLACLRSWQNMGIKVALLHADDRALGPTSRSRFDHYHFVGPVGALDGAAFIAIARQLAALDARGLVCVADALAQKLWRQREHFAPEMRLLLCKPEPLARLDSKIHQLKAARACGFKLLPSWILEAAPLPIPGKLPYPLVLRPDRAGKLRPMFKAKLLRSEVEAFRFFAALEEGSGMVVAQPFIAGPSVVIHGARDHDGRVGPLARYIVDVKYQGVSATLRPAPLSPETEAACRAFVEQEDIVGVFHFDLLQGADGADGTEWFLELNARLGGTTAKVYAGGFDEPAALLRAHGLLAHGAPPGLPALKPVVSRIATTKCVLAALRGRASEIDHPYPDMSALLGSAATAFCCWDDEVLSLRGLRSALAYLFPAL